MAIVLDAETEERIHRQLARGGFSGPDELLTHALDLIEAEVSAEDWLLRNKDAIIADIERTSAQAARGDGYSPEESRAELARHRASRAARAA